MAWRFVSRVSPAFLKSAGGWIRTDLTAGANAAGLKLLLFRGRIQTMALRDTWRQGGFGLLIGFHRPRSSCSTASA